MSLLARNVSLAMLVVPALGIVAVQALIKGLLVIGYLWGRLGFRGTFKALGRSGPPLGGRKKIMADLDVLALTAFLLYLAVRVANLQKSWLEPSLADQWASGIWAKAWMVPAAVCAVMLILIKLLDLVITLASMKTLEEDLGAEAPTVRRRLIFLAGMEFVLWRVFGWLARVALFLGRIIPGSGVVRMLLGRAVEASRLPPTEFYRRFYEELEDESRRKRVWATADYVARFLAVRGFMVLFFGLSLL
jgi:hypothetical protein